MHSALYATLSIPHISIPGHSHSSDEGGIVTNAQTNLVGVLIVAVGILFTIYIALRVKRTLKEDKQGRFIRMLKMSDFRKKRKNAKKEISEHTNRKERRLNIKRKNRKSK